MIGRLRGLVALKGADHALIDVGGVGYVVHCSDRTLAALAPGTQAEIWTEMLVREDLMQLFGFLTPQERDWHRLLTTVQGVGAKASMAILGTLTTEALARAIALGDWGSVRAAPGVGPKLAQRVVNELKDKAPAAMGMGGAGPGPAATAAPQPAGPARAPDALVEPDLPGSAAAQAEALSALTNLGYAPQEAAAAVARAAGEAPDATTAALIRAALKALAPKD
ncbi:Holliday junction branch migration protein RuvA [Rhodobacterales bacterium HKCCE2091]|nr:Holliday junction branch migration protein RuvA [Rhodobacterales bacterium HKCCE2091]